MIFFFPPKRLTIIFFHLTDRANSFLQIYLAGFTTSQRDKLNRILNVGSATRLNDISDALTHVIIGDENKASNELKSMKSAGLWYLFDIIFSLILYYVLIRRRTTTKSLSIKTLA